MLYSYRTALAHSLLSPLGRIIQGDNISIIGLSGSPVSALGHEGQDHMSHGTQNTHKISSGMAQRHSP